MNALVLLVLFAPAPMAKSTPPVTAIKSGSYLMTWRGIDAPAIFHADGFYACQWQGRWWHGHWRQENGELMVEEWPMDQPNARSKWSIKLSSPLGGELTGGTNWRLVPQVFGPGGDA